MDTISCVSSDIKRQLHIIPFVTAGIKSLIPFHKPLKFTRFWGFLVAIINTLKPLSVMCGDNESETSTDCPSGYTDEELQSIIIAVTTAGNQSVDDICIDCLVINAQHIEYDIHRWCNKHAYKGMRSGAHTNKPECVLTYRVVYNMASSSFSKGCYMGLMMSYASFLPPLMPAEHISRPKIDQPCQTHIIKDIHDKTVDFYEGSKIFKMNNTLSNGNHLVCELCTTGNNIYWLVFVLTNNETGVEQILGMIRVIAYTGISSHIMIFRFRKNIVPYDGIYPRFFEWHIDGSGIALPKLKFYRPWCREMLYCINECLVADGHFKYSIEVPVLNNLDGEQIAIFDVGGEYITHHDSISGGLINGHSEYHIATTTGTGSPKNHVSTIMQYSKHFDFSTARQAVTMMKQRNKELGFALRCSWMSAVMRAANARVTHM